MYTIEGLKKLISQAKEADRNKEENALDTWIKASKYVIELRKSVESDLNFYNASIIAALTSKLTDYYMQTNNDESSTPRAKL